MQTYTGISALNIKRVRVSKHGTLVLAQAWSDAFRKRGKFHIAVPRLNNVWEMSDN